jgi:hypothetical protein
VHWHTGFSAFALALTASTAAQLTLSWWARPSTTSSVEKHREQTQKRLMAIARKDHVGHVLARFRVEPAELFELYNYLERANLHDIAFEIMSSPGELEELIELYRQQKPLNEVNAHFRQRQ